MAVGKPIRIIPWQRWWFWPTSVRETALGESRPSNISETKFGSEPTSSTVAKLQRELKAIFMHLRVRSAGHGIEKAA
jgi:hypothetical protein